VGVQVGDWFSYKGTLISWEGAYFPPSYIGYLQTYNESDWIRYTVTGITPDDDGDIVTFSVLTHWKNGTETTSTLDDNMASSESLMVIGANLPDYTEIRPEYSILDIWPMPARYLNASIMRAIDNETRATNALDYYSNIFEQIYHYKYYWDKAIGIQVYFQSDTTDSEDDLGNIFSYNCTLELIDSSSSDIIPELTTVVMLSMLVVITIPIVLYRKKNCPTNFFP
jgi:hypothetical protein